MPSGIHAISEEKCRHLRGELEHGYLLFFFLNDVEVIIIQVWGSRLLVTGGRERAVEG